MPPVNQEIAVPLLDLKAQYATIRAEIQAAIEPVIESQMFILGSEVEAIEREIADYSGTAHGVGCASGSDAIMLALMGLDIGAGDEVLCPSYTFFATAGYITRTGATPVFVEIDPVTYNMDVEATRRAAAKCRNLRAIMPVHLFGQCADMDGLLALGAELGVPVIEDAAQAIGAEDVTGARAGSRGAAGCFSFFPSKNLGAFGDGGLITTNDADYAERMRIIRMHGSKPKYYHRMVGVNSRLDALQAAILRVKLRYLDGWTEGRQRNAAFYDAAFAPAGATTTSGGFSDDGIALMTPEPAAEGARHIYNQYVIRVPAEFRDDLREHLRERRIGTEIYYPVPLHLQECFRPLGLGEGDLPHTERAANESLALPIYPELTQDQLTHVATTVIEFMQTRAAVRS